MKENTKLELLENQVENKNNLVNPIPICVRNYVNGKSTREAEESFIDEFAERLNEGGHGGKNGIKFAVADSGAYFTIFVSEKDKERAEKVLAEN